MCCYKLMKLFISTLLMTILMMGCNATPATPQNTPDRIATAVEEAVAVAATLTARAPTTSPINTPTYTPTYTPTIESDCIPDSIVQGEVNDAIPGYIDIISVSTNLVGPDLTAVFSLREVPQEITVNNNNLYQGEPEIGWGVAIDTDNNPNTGVDVDWIMSGYGYESILLAFNAKNGPERSGTIQDIFQDKVDVYFKVGNTMTRVFPGIINVDPDAKTLTLRGEIIGITSNSSLFFFTFQNNGNFNTIEDYLCQRK